MGPMYEQLSEEKCQRLARRRRYRAGLSHETACLVEVSRPWVRRLNGRPFSTQRSRRCRTLLHFLFFYSIAGETIVMTGMWRLVSSLLSFRAQPPDVLE